MTATEKREARERAGFREKYAMEHGKARKIKANGKVFYKFTYSKEDSYQDANGATYDATRKAWVN